MDYEIGKNEYLRAASSPARKILAEILSLSCDESIWSGIPAVVGSTLFVLRGLSATNQMGCLEEACWDVFGTSGGLLIILEQLGKVLTKRPRPTYHAKNAEQKVWVYHGEWWSMPSGHTLRAAYLAHYLAVGTIAPPRLLRLRAGGSVFPAAPLLVWAALVGWSRVAKGRHYPGDCVVGWLLGHGLGLYLEGYAAPRFRCMAKIIGGFLFVPQWGAYYVVPLVKTFAANSSNGVQWAVGALVGLLFSLFYGRLALETVWKGQSSCLSNNWECSK